MASEAAITDWVIIICSLQVFFSNSFQTEKEDIIEETPVDTTNKNGGNGKQKKMEKEKHTKGVTEEDEVEDSKLNEGEYEVEAIMGMKRGKDEYMYLVKWKGYEKGTWEPRRNLFCDELLDEFVSKIVKGQKNESGNIQESKQGNIFPLNV